MSQASVEEENTEFPCLQNLSLLRTLVLVATMPGSPVLPAEVSTGIVLLTAEDTYTLLRHRNLAQITGIFRS